MTDTKRTDAVSQNERLPENVPYIVYEAEMSRAEMRYFRLFKFLIVVVVMLFISNIFNIYMWSKYEISSEELTVEVDSDGGGNASCIGVGNDGDITIVENPSA